MGHATCVDQLAVLNPGAVTGPLQVLLDLLSGGESNVSFREAHLINLSGAGDPVGRFQKW